MPRFGVRFQVEGVFIDDADRQPVKIEGVAVEHAADGDGAGEFKDFVEVFGEFAHTAITSGEFENDWRMV